MGAGCQKEDSEPPGVASLYIIAFLASVAYQAVYCTLEEGKHDKSEYHTSPDHHWIVAAGALESAQSYLAGSAGPSAPRDGSSEAFSSSFAAFVEWAIQNRLILAEAEFPFLKRIPDASGEEHEAWFDEDSNLWFKLTYRNHFGLPWGRSGSAQRTNMYRVCCSRTHSSRMISGWWPC
jgi:hypothetical protein